MMYVFLKDVLRYVKFIRFQLTTLAMVNSEWKTLTEIGKETGLNTGDLDIRLMDLEFQGLIERRYEYTKVGFYTITTTYFRLSEVEQ